MVSREGSGTSLDQRGVWKRPKKHTILQGFFGTPDKTVRGEENFKVVCLAGVVTSGSVP